ncbi:hypothetical protein BpHYR1_023370 [Brachionus plicatilis]|uniref:Uncharacterized protein n=1 Tax=Brachionus plicatilis TaxID=10195 RepID=A0A3M7QCW5_BRAPC|nr:hypothetical protein BpHYR1_023370 [Brachionus plicatilis]
MNRKGENLSALNLNAGDPNPGMKNLSRFEIPQNENFLEEANVELNKFKEFLNRLLQMNQSASTNKISFAENLAFRLLGTIDWHKSNFDELKQFIQPFLNSHHLNLDHLIFKENGKFLHLKQCEAHEAIHTWTEYRTRMNTILIENPEIFSLTFSHEKKEKKHFWHKNKKIEGPFENLLGFNNIQNRLKEIMILYLIAKWSKDDSSLKFSTFFHYGIPRARVRQSTLGDSSIILSENVKDVSVSSGTSSMNDRSNLIGSSSALSSPSDSSSKVEQDFVQTKQSNVRYYTRPCVRRRIRRTNNSSSNLSSFNSSREREPEQTIREPVEEKEKVPTIEPSKRADLKYVSGGIVTNTNVYFPVPRK